MSASGVFEVVCPCCGARLKLDALLGKVIARKPAAKPVKAPNLERASKLLEKEAQRREALFRQSVEEEKVKTKLLERRFKEALERSKDEPPTPPTRDIDLD